VEEKMDRLLEEMFDKTRNLAHMVEQEGTEPDEWMAVLDEREILIGEVQLLLSQGYTLTPRQRRMLEQMQELNLNMMPHMEKRKADVKRKLDDIRKKKAVHHLYNKAGLAGYGAFFDKRN